MAHAIADAGDELPATGPAPVTMPTDTRHYGLVDHLSHFTGLMVAFCYVVAAGATLWEVGARYIFHAPTQWVFETVMVLCGAAWMLSAGFITQRERHIAITVFSSAVSPAAQRRLALFANLTGVVALFLLLADASVAAYEAVALVERSGSAFNSPMPTVHKLLLLLGGWLYLAQLMVNLRRQMRSSATRRAVQVAGWLMLAYFANGALAAWGGEASVFGRAAEAVSHLAALTDVTQQVDVKQLGLGWISLLMVAALVLLMTTGMPLGIVTMTVSVVMALLFFGPKGLYLVSSNVVELLSQYTLVAIPFFVMMASVLERAGIAEDLFDAMAVFAGNLRGGVAVQTTVVAVILAAMSGVMGGEIVMLGLVALPQMFRLGYDRKLTIGLICAAGALATLIPPSVVMIVYGLSAEVGIGDLFMAGFVPGFLLAALYVGYVLVRVHLNPKLAPTAAEAAALTGQDRRLTPRRLQAVFLSIALIGGVMGSIYGGIASVTEAAAVGAVGAVIVAMIRAGFQWGAMKTSLMGTMSTVGTIVWLVLGAVSFVGIYNLIGGAEFMRSLFLNLGLPALGVVLMMMLILAVLGTFMEWIAIVLITVPVFAPVVVQLAPDLGLTADQAKIWFGILFVMNIQIYFLSPPFGPACFWLKSVAPKDVTLHEIFLAVLPFIALQVLGLVLVIIFPDLALWLPRVLGH